jgi:hypothetical protein
MFQNIGTRSKESSIVQINLFFLSNGKVLNNRYIKWSHIFHLKILKHKIEWLGVKLVG